MNSEKDAQLFVAKFQEYARNNDTNLFFNTYKSKVERITNNTRYKQYNALNPTSGTTGAPDMMIKQQQTGRYQRYNEFPTPMMSNFIN